MVNYRKKNKTKNKTKIYGKRKKLTENDGKMKKRRIKRRGGALGTIADPTIGRCSPSLLKTWRLIVAGWRLSGWQE